MFRRHGTLQVAVAGLPWLMLVFAPSLVFLDPPHPLLLPLLQRRSSAAHRLRGLPFFEAIARTLVGSAVL